MPVTYTVTDSSGHKHTRTSARDNEARYTHAVVRFPGCNKHHVSYHGSERLALNALSQALSRITWGERKGQTLYPLADIFPVVAVVKIPQKRRPA